MSKVLVIAPKKVAEATWAREAEKWDHLKGLKVVEVLGPLTKRVRALNTPADVYVTSRDLVQWLVDYYRNDWPFDMVVIDELSSFKNHQAKRFKSLVMVRSRIKRIVGLTGTPAPNGLIDLWAQVYLLDEGKRLGKHVTHFRDRYFDPDQRDREHIFSYKPKPGADNVIRNLIGDICISMGAKDYLDMPDFVEVDVPVILDSKARGLYDQMERDMLLEINDQTIDAGTVAVLTNKLLQLCNGAVYDESKQIAEVHKCKLETFSELAEGLNGDHALVFYSFKHDLVRLKQVLMSTGLRVAELKGPEDADSWNAGEVDILLAHPASCAYGLNLQQGGHHIIWFGLNWSLELYQQANARLYRQGQGYPVVVHRMVVDNSMDESVIKAISDKSGIQDRLMEALKARIRGYRDGQRDIKAV